MLINEIKTPYDVLEFMKDNIKYGWLDINNEIHIGNMKNFRKLYRTLSIDEILKVDELSIKFYTRNNNEQIRRQIAENLSYLKNYENIEKLEVNFNINELTITHKEKAFPEEHYNYGNNEDDYDDRYKFGCIYR